MSGYVKFTGEWNKLLGMGFVYPKVYDGSRVMYKKDGLTIYRSQSEVYLNNFDLYKFINFMRCDPITLFTDDTLYVYRLNIENEYHYLPVNNHNRYIASKLLSAHALAMHEKRETSTVYMGIEYMDRPTFNVIKELMALGWLELVEYP